MVITFGWPGFLLRLVMFTMLLISISLLFFAVGLPLVPAEWRDVLAFNARRIILPIDAVIALLLWTRTKPGSYFRNIAPGAALCSLALLGMAEWLEPH